MTDLQAQAKQILASLRQPKRRAIPRVCPLFEAADHAMIGMDGAKVAAWRLDHGGQNQPAVLLVHGWEDDTSLWTPLVEQFSARGRPVVAFDLPGHGHSDGDHCDIELTAAAISSVAEYFGPIDAVCGHSFGGPAMVAALNAGLSVKTCALISPPVFQGLQFERRARRYEVPEPLIEAMMIEGNKTGRFFDLVAEVANLSPDALFIHSLDDEQCPADEAQMAANAWPSARFWPVDGLGHRALIKDDAVVSMLVAWLDSEAG